MILSLILLLSLSYTTAFSSIPPLENDCIPMLDVLFPQIIQSNLSIISNNDTGNVIRSTWKNTYGPLLFSLNLQLDEIRWEMEEKRIKLEAVQKEEEDWEESDERREEEVSFVEDLTKLVSLFDNGRQIDEEEEEEEEENDYDFVDFPVPTIIRIKRSPLAFLPMLTTTLTRVSMVATRFAGMATRMASATAARSAAAAAIRHGTGIARLTTRGSYSFAAQIPMRTRMFNGVRRALHHIARAKRLHPGTFKKIKNTIEILSITGFSIWGLWELVHIINNEKVEKALELLHEKMQQEEEKMSPWQLEFASKVKEVDAIWEKRPRTPLEIELEKKGEVMRNASDREDEKGEGEYVLECTYTHLQTGEVRPFTELEYNALEFFTDQTGIECKQVKKIRDHVPVDDLCRYSSAEDNYCINTALQSFGEK